MLEYSGDLVLELTVEAGRGTRSYVILVLRRAGTRNTRCYVEAGFSAWVSGLRVENIGDLGHSSFLVLVLRGISVHGSCAVCPLY